MNIVLVILCLTSCVQCLVSSFFSSVFYENDEYYCAPSELMSKEEGAAALLTRMKV